MRKIRIYIVDDEPGMLEVCEDTLNALSGVEIEVESDSRKAARRLAENGFDLLLTDIRMPGVDGIELLRIAREKDPNLPVLILTAYPSVETAVESMKLGASDYIVKPFNTDDLLATVKRLIEEQQLRDENQLLRRQVERSYAFGEMLGKSEAMQKIFHMIGRVAETDVDVLVLGETGTGKELVARSIHQRSSRASKRFVPVDCGAIPKELMESEFFGHEKGAFTGAQTRNLGLLEYANQGTIFLDEIGHLSPALQAKLLRALQERTIRRLGSNRQLEIDVRVVAATSLDLDAEVKAGRFRIDLYYRINVARVELPPLREREGDIPLLAERLLKNYVAEMGKRETKLSPEALEVLSAYSWPGNVRELQNVLKRTLAMVRHDVIVPEDLPDPVFAAARHLPAAGDDGFFAKRERRVANFEREYLTSLLANTSGDVSQAARDAQMPRGTLYRLLKNHELDPADFRSDNP